MFNDESSHRYYHLSFRVAIITGTCIGILIFLLAIWFVSSPLRTAVLFGAITFAAAFLIVFVSIRSLLVKRLRTVERITHNIAQKQFEDYKLASVQKKDELDGLVVQAKNASKTVEREIARLNKIENYRKEFIGDISHELKTPIFAIQGFIETLLAGAMDDETVNRQFLEKAQRNANRLSYLTKDLMEISKLETGELKSSIKAINLADVLEEVVENLQYKAEKEGVLIEVENIDKNLTVKADRNQLKQVFINLIENAVKYNKIGGMVTIGTNDYGAEFHKILVRVSDTGIGIEPQYMERITERFFRIDKSRSREKGGTGLGLAIVKHIMEAHGEEFFVKSRPGEGSEFSFTLTKAGVEE